MKELLSEDLGRPRPGNKNVERMAGEEMAMMLRVRKV
jgi:hypothetical protein